MRARLTDGSLGGGNRRRPNNAFLIDVPTVRCFSSSVSQPLTAWCVTSSSGANRATSSGTSFLHVVLRLGREGQLRLSCVEVERGGRGVTVPRAIAPKRWRAVLLAGCSAELDYADVPHSAGRRSQCSQPGAPGFAGASARRAAAL